MKCYVSAQYLQANGKKTVISHVTHALLVSIYIKALLYQTNISEQILNYSQTATTFTHQKTPERISKIILELPLTFLEK